MWMEGLPYWLWAVIFALFLMSMRTRARVTKEIIVSSRWSIILPWVMYLVVIVVVDASTGALVFSFTDRVLLNIAALLLFVVSAVFGLKCHWRHVLHMVGFLGFLFGVLALAQFAGIETAWRLPEMLSLFSSVNVIDGLQNTGAITEEDLLLGFEKNNRVRGLDMFVHKFAAYQGIIAAMTIVYTLSFWQLMKQRKQFHWGAIILILLFALVGFLGLLLTFSRAPTLGIVLAIFVTIWYTSLKKKLVTLVVIVLFSGALVAMFIMLEMSQETQLSRLITPGDTATSDALRMASILHSIDLFLNNPIFGVGSNSMFGLDMSTHSVPLRVLSDFGLFGFFFYALVWRALLKNAYLAIRQSDVEIKLIGIVVMAALVVAIMDNLTHSSGLLQRDTAQPALLGLCYGLTVGALRRKHA